MHVVGQRRRIEGGLRGFSALGISHAMEESYGAVGLAIFRLAADSGEEAEYLKSQAILRSVLQRHPVIRGFALSTLARRLREGE